MLRTAVGLRGIEPAQAKRCDLPIMEGHHALVFQGKRQDAADSIVIVKEWVLNPLNEYFALHDRWHTPNRKGINVQSMLTIPRFVGPEDLDTFGRRRRPPMKRGCRPIGVSVIQQMMQHYLWKATLLTLKDDETG